MTNKILCLTLAVSMLSASMTSIYANNAENEIVDTNNEVTEKLTVEYGTVLEGEKLPLSLVSSNPEVVRIDENNKALAVGIGEAVLSYRIDNSIDLSESESVLVTVERKKLSADGIKVFPIKEGDLDKVYISTPAVEAKGKIEGDNVYISTKEAKAEIVQQSENKKPLIKIKGISLLGADSEKYELENTEIEVNAALTDEINADVLAGSIEEIYQPEGVFELNIPKMPEGFEISIKSTSDKNTIADDFSVMPHKDDKEVTIVLSVKENIEHKDEDNSIPEEEITDKEEKPDKDTSEGGTDEEISDLEVQEKDAENKELRENVVEGEDESDKEVSKPEPLTVDTKEIKVLVKGTDVAVINVESTEGGLAEGGGSYNMGDEVRLKAVADEGYVFNGWDVCGEIISTEPEYTFNAERVMKIKATFIDKDSKKVYVTVEKSHEDKTVEGEGEYAYGDTVTLKAGTGFKHWSINGEKISESNPYTFTATEDVTVTANFKTSSGGGSLNTNFTYYTVKFHSNGGTRIDDIKVAKNTVAKEPAAPERKGYEFTGWYTDEELKNKFDFKNTRLFDNLELYAGWKRTESDDKESQLPFTDVKNSAWYQKAVDFVYNNKLMLGMTDTTFEPETKLTRAMFVTVLYRAAKGEVKDTTLKFNDVSDDSWYKDAVLWATENKIVYGYDENTFAPTDYITREQLAVMMYRYAKFAGVDMNGSADISGFEDAEEVSRWAVAAVKWAVSVKLIEGMDEKTLMPKGTATRAQCAQILMNSIENLKLMSDDAE